MSVQHPSTSPTTASRRDRPLALVLAAAIALAACSGDDAGGASLSDEGVAIEEPAAREAAPDAAPGQEGDEAAAGGGNTDVPAAVDRQLIYRATVELSSDDPDDAVARVEAATTAAGGFVAGTQLQRDDLDLLRGSITIRVPADALDELLAEVAAIGEVTARTQSVEDVSGQVADLDSRLRNLRALEEELLVLLTEARERGDTDDVLAVFDRVGQVRGEVEVLEGRRASIGDQVALSTLTVQVEPSRSLVESRRSEPDDELPLPWSPGNVAASAWDATVASLQSFVDTVIRGVLFLLPVLLVWMSPLWLALAVLLWWRRRRPTTGTSAPVGSAPPVPPSPPGGAGQHTARAPDAQPVAREEAQSVHADRSPNGDDHDGHDPADDPVGTGTGVDTHER